MSNVEKKSRNYPKKKKVVARKRVYHKRPARAYVSGSGGYRYNKKSAGAQIGAMLGDGAQQLLKYVTGFGDYTVETNSIMGGVYDPPELHNKNSDCVTIRHREYLADITSSSDFSLQSFPINPGMDETFPWLAAVASSFEEYRITGLIFEYKTLSADFSNQTGAALGYVAMATQYNLYNPDFPNKKTLENYSFSNSAKPSHTFIHPVECKKSLNPVSELYVRTDNNINGDLRLYDLGKFQIATGGCNSNGAILGELWATYEIQFFKPKLSANLGYSLACAHYRFAANTITPAAPFGTSAVLAPNSSLEITLDYFSRSIEFPKNIVDGQYMIFWTMTGSLSSPQTIAPSVNAQGCTLLKQWFNNQSATAANPFVSQNGTTVVTLCIMVKVDAPGCYVELVGGNFPVGQTFGDLYVTQVDAAMP